MTKKSKFKIQRQLGVVLPGFGDKKEKGPLAKRPTPPGFHGKTKNRRTSDYGIRLKEKQKIRFHYGLKEKQVRTYVKKSKKKESNWMVAFTDFVERRLDNVAFRSGFFPTMASARQAIVHGHVVLNGKKCDLPSLIVPLGAEITLTAKMAESKLVQGTMQSPTLEVPHFLKVETKDKKPVATLIETPRIEDIPFEFQIQYFIEFYGKLA